MSQIRKRENNGNPSKQAPPSLPTCALEGPEEEDDRVQPSLMLLKTERPVASTPIVHCAKPANDVSGLTLLSTSELCRPILTPPAPAVYHKY